MSTNSVLTIVSLVNIKEEEEETKKYLVIQDKQQLDFFYNYSKTYNYIKLVFLYN